ncbi:class I SAM-dependent methyltransferase [Aliiroseovarius sp. 2305UL8-7]|uniref:class I SAM-dependent methyltransferase n=1 Tax=Aliiroseovarius conchicola TaxID=3121637 RepID=UPI0035295685
MISSAKFWDDAAPKYAKTPIKDEESYRYTLERTRSYLGAQDYILEIGSGTGSTAMDLAPNVAHITATDISPKMIEIGQKKAKAHGIENVSFQVASAALRDIDGPFDAVLAHNVLHLVDDLPSTLGRAHALLKPGGTFVSKTFCKPRGFGPAIYYAMCLALPVMKLLGKAPNVLFLAIEELEGAITAQGFEIIESGSYPAKELRRYIVARRPVA